MRELIWVRRLVNDIATGFGITYNRCAVIKSKVHEDNQAAIAIAYKPDLTARTRHLHVKYHHFRDHLKVDKKGDGIKVEYIKTGEQIADLLTKGLGNNKFIPLRNALMGWPPELDVKMNASKRES